MHSLRGRIIWNYDNYRWFITYYILYIAAKLLYPIKSVCSVLSADNLTSINVLLLFLFLSGKYQPKCCVGSVIIIIIKKKI
jgi:hypothetical protein